MSPHSKRLARVLNVALLVVVAVALVGYFTGTLDRHYLPDTRSEDVHLPSASLAQFPPHYATVDRSRAELPSTHSAAGLVASSPSPAKGLSGSSATARQLRRRMGNRAFAGAPPTIPHEVSARSLERCAFCHDNGIRIGEATAPQPGHEKRSNCTQCHIPSLRPNLLAKASQNSEAVYNTFVGASEPSGGSRAWGGAPPDIPHSVAMRENCAVCHGPNGRPGLLTSHPHRHNCRQCHAASQQSDTPPALVLTTD